MFEQESYDRATVPTPTQPGELFYNYEIRSWFFTPALYKMLAIAAVVNLVFLAGISQTNVLTARGCDSPWVGRVCQVVDMAYVGAVLFGTEREYVDQEYEKTELGDADITFIDVTGEAPPLSYPEGYFQIANPVQFAMLQQQAANGLPGVNTSTFTSANTYGSSAPNNDASLYAQKQDLPKANPNSFEDDTVSKPPASTGTTTPNSGSFSRRKGSGGRIRPGGITPEKPKEDITAEKVDPPQTITKTDPITGDEINNRPFKDLGTFVNDALDKKETDLQSEFRLTATGKLNKDGKLDPKSFKYTTAESADKKLIEVVQEAIEAFNDSGRLNVLKALTGKDLNLNVQQDGSSIAAVVQSELENEGKAKAVQSSLILLLAGAKVYKSGANADQNDKDDLLLLEGAKIEQDGKNLIIKFNVPKDVVHQMIQRKLAEAKKAASEPSSTALTGVKITTAGK